MLTTLKAVVRGDRIEWLEASEAAFPPADSVTALITSLQAHTKDVTTPAQRIERRLAALRSLVQAGAFSGIASPEEWQRETREDRELPGRS